MTGEELLTLVYQLLTDYMGRGANPRDAIVIADGAHVFLFQSSGDHLALSVEPAEVRVSS